MTDRIVIAGGGVAGMAAARRLSLSGHRPLLLAPAAEVPARGETLSPKALPLLEQLGWAHLLDDGAAFAGEARFSIWGSARLRRADDPHGAGYHLDRARFEAAMAAALSDCDKRIGTAHALHHHPDGVVVTLADGTSIEAAALIDATGRAALSSGPAAGRRRLDRLVALYCVAGLPDDVDLAPATLVEATDLGWWYMAPVPGQRMMLGLFTDSDLVPKGAARDGARWLDLAASTQGIAARIDSLGLADRLAADAPRSAAAASIVNAQLVEGRIIRAGDAAAALDPLAANGLATALWSGEAAAHAALALIEGDGRKAEAYERAYLTGIAGQLETQSSMYGAEGRFETAEFWRRRHLS